MEKLGPDDPHRIGAYRLLSRLGEGGMGQVFLARSDRGRTVALKLVRRELAEQPEFRARFRQEVRAAQQVGGAWTAPVLDADTEAPVPWVATGYVAGPSLQGIVTGRTGVTAPASGAYGPLPERSVQLLGSGLAHALQHIHGAGLIHRDLKPSNVLMTIDGPRVIDFGIARAMEVADAGITRTGALVGSPGFMAPEQVRGERVTAACDVFCLGSVLAYAATGRLPFGTAESGGVHALMFRIAQEAPDLTGVPVDLVELIADCLAKDPAARPTTDEILERLGEAEATEPWLPGTLIAELGRHAVELLNAEDPEQPPSGTHRLLAQPERPTPTSTPTPAAAPQPPPHSATPTPPPHHQQKPQPQPRQQHQPQQPQHVHQTFGQPYQPPHQTPAPTRRSTGSTIALVTVAVLVAIGAGGSVYAFMNDTGKDTADAPTNSPSGEGKKGKGSAVPDDYLGTWTGTANGSAGTSTRRLVIRQGGVGDAVLSLTVKGPLASGGTYRCVFSAPLADRPTSGDPVHIGPSTVSVGEPATSCSPGKATDLTLLPDGTLRRATAGTDENLVYTKSD
ncbi:serine/threonine protein kinase [Streptomyces sp. NBC_01433]|uniref:serine/threonine-protein kinase n=1 Tax=Streptomyces sp. NBC_01433 TaxID=2903864 RepID=UPI00225BB824|nr:serine/threonine-protein kinase [Streptomyces sp. NBC_01433]MCX4676097.1 serine/threonine protein kinase [Streptomyces sp. NBC_01433]